MTEDKQEGSGAEHQKLMAGPSDDVPIIQSVFATDKPNMNGKLSQYLAASAGNLCALACGIALGWPSPGLEKLSNADTTPLDSIATPEQLSWVGSLIALGAALGPFPAGYMTNKMGRKGTLLVAMVPILMAWFMMVTTCNIIQIYAARLLMGLSVGAVFTALPMYIAEISEDSIRGSLGSIMQLFITLGLLLAYAIGPYVSFFWLGMVCYSIPIMFLVIFISYPESPYYLVSVGRRKEAEEALFKLRGLSGEAIAKEIALLQESVDETSANTGDLRDILNTPANRKAIFLSLGLVAGQQFAGINVVLFYTQTIFEATGSTIPSPVAVIIVGLVQVLASFITPVIVEKAGRRLLLLTSAIGMAICLGVLGVYFWMKTNGTDVTSISFVPVVSLVGYMIVYCLGFGPLPWAVMAELLTPEIKSTGSTATASCCWFLGFVMTKFFGTVAAWLGMAGAFWIFSACCIVSTVFVYQFLPETKGKTAQQIQAELAGYSEKSAS